MEVKLKLTAEEHKDLVAYCNLNDLLISSVVKDSFTTGFNIERYGLLNAGPQVKEKIVEKEVIKYVEVPKIEEKEVVKIEYVEVEKVKPVEVIKEVPVEKIVEKEIIKEVPIDRIVEKIVEITKEVPVEKIVVQEVIKEVPVDKVVYVTDQQELNEKIFQKDQEYDEQRKKFSSKISEMENIFQEEKNSLLQRIQQLENTEPQKVEVEKIVEIIKEVPVEVVIEKMIDGGVDKNKFDALQQTVMKLRQETLDKDKLIKDYEKTILEMQKFQNSLGAAYFKGSNLDDKLYK